MVKVKVTSYNHKNNWYKDCVGQIFECKPLSIAYDKHDKPHEVYYLIDNSGRAISKYNGINITRQQKLERILNVIS